MDLGHRDGKKNLSFDHRVGYSPIKRARNSNIVWFDDGTKAGKKPAGETSSRAADGCRKNRSAWNRDIEQDTDETNSLVLFGTSIPAVSLRIKRVNFFRFIWQLFLFLFLFFLFFFCASCIVEIVKIRAEFCGFFPASGRNFFYAAKECDKK